MPRFTDLPLAGPPLDGSLGGPIMITSMGNVQGVAAPSAIPASIQQKQQSSQQKPASLLTMSSPPVGLPIQQQPNALNQQVDVIAQQQPCMVTSPPPSQQPMSAYPQYVIAQPQQHIPYAMTIGAKQVG